MVTSTGHPSWHRAAVLVRALELGFGVAGIGSTGYERNDRHSPARTLSYRARPDCPPHFSTQVSLIAVLHQALGYSGGPGYKNSFVRPTGGTCDTANGATSGWTYDSDGYATDTNGAGCYYNCTNVDTPCGDISSSDCCIFYPENIHTDVHELNDLGSFAEVCDHAKWDADDHILNWFTPLNSGSEFERFHD